MVSEQRLWDLGVGHLFILAKDPFTGDVYFLIPQELVCPIQETCYS